MQSQSRSSSITSMSLGNEQEADTPISSADSLGDEVSHKRQKLEHSTTTNGDNSHKPVFLKMSFRKPGETDEADPIIEDDATFDARPWQEKSTIVPLLVAFRIQFSELFEGVPDMGPQDLEEGIESDEPSQDVQEFMCRLLTLAANRARPVEYPHYNRPLNDCVAVFHASRGDPAWEGINPLASNKRFPDLTSEDRLRLMYCLLDWSLTESKVVRDRIEEAYKNRTAPRIQTQNPYELSVIGRDDRKHGYYLLKGKNTRFRLYVETDLTKTPARWYSICSTLEDLRLYTSQLSDSARTVRCRKIVDDLASIHIPEVERAEEARRQNLLRKQRALQERSRRAAYIIDREEAQGERASRTRGRRVDYNNMLQGQGDDEDGRDTSRAGTRYNTPDFSTPQSSRSGRMLKRPRPLVDDSPEPDFWKIVPDHSTEGPMAVRAAETPEESSESHIVILKYNKNVFRNWVHKPWASIPLPPETPFQKRQKAIDSVVVPEPLSEEHQSLTKLYGPMIAAQMMSTKMNVATSKSDTGAVALSAVDNSNNVGPSPNVPQISTSHNGQIPLNSHDSSTETQKESGTSALKQEIAATDGTTDVRLTSPHKCLVLATLRTSQFNIESHLLPTLRNIVEHAARQQVPELYIWLSTTTVVQQTWSGHQTNAFSQIQKAISDIYINMAVLSKEAGASIETTVIFKDWCGYDLALEDVHWSALASDTNDRDFVDTFLAAHKSTFPERALPITLQSASLFGDMEQRNDTLLEPRIYKVVAVGGTFDHLHAGHKILLTMTAWLAQERVVCGITDDALLVNKKHKEVMENLAARSQGVRKFYHTLRRDIQYDLIPINDVAGPTGTDSSIQALVASRETEAGSAQITEIRRQKDLPPLDILFIDVIGAEGRVQGDQMAELKLSSTAIRQRLMSKI